ncbi:MAG: RrF2 family transcriptional regulator [bacterium]
MQKVANITEKSNIIIHSLAFIAAHPELEVVPVKLIAKELAVSGSYLAKVLQPAVKDGLLNSLRGAKGGYSLKKPAKEIKLLNLLIFLEGKLSFSECLFDKARCDDKKCPFRQLSVKLRDLIIKELSDLTIADVAKNFKPKTTSNNS